MKTVQQIICKITQLFHVDLECEICHSRPQHSLFTAVIVTSNSSKIIEVNINWDLLYAKGQIGMYEHCTKKCYCDKSSILCNIKG